MPDTPLIENDTEMVINFSGGADSTAMLAILCEQYPNVKKHVVFADTGWEHVGAQKWCEDLVDQFDLKTHTVKNPNKTFLSMIRNRQMFPSPKYRQCTSDLKRGPIQTWIRRNISSRKIINCLGIRAQESPGRARQPVYSLDNRMSNSKRTVWNFNPIHAWNYEEVRSFLADRQLPLHPVYKYLNRFSCRVCIFMSIADLTAVRRHDPAGFKIIAELEHDIGFSMKPEGTLEEIVR